MKKSDLLNNINNIILNTTTKGFLDNDELLLLRNNYIDGVVYKGMEYRPDLIAEYYLKDSNLGWLILYVNDCFNGIKDLRVGKKIKIPRI